MEEVVCTIDTAISCGLIVTELVTNTIHHAYSKGTGNPFSVKLASFKDDEVVLTVSDNGCGVLDGFDFRKNETLGLRTVFELAEYQLNGNIEFESKNGVSCTLRFRNKILSAF